jgi:hypothetical protein
MFYLSFGSQMDFTLCNRELSRYSDRLRAGVQFLAGARDFSVLHSVQNGSGVLPATHLMGTGVEVTEV